MVSISPQFQQESPGLPFHVTSQDLHVTVSRAGRIRRIFPVRRFPTTIGL